MGSACTSPQPEHATADSQQSNQTTKDQKKSSMDQATSKPKEDEKSNVETPHSLSKAKHLGKDKHSIEAKYIRRESSLDKNHNFFQNTKKKISPDNSIEYIIPKSKILHHFNKQLPSASVEGLTGDIEDDHMLVWKQIQNIERNETYKTFVTSDISSDKYVIYPEFLLDYGKDWLSIWPGYVPLLSREWIIEKSKEVKKEDDSLSFTMVQFNMLADGLSGAYYKNPEKNSKAFLNVNPHCLEWSFRGIRILLELLWNNQWHGNTPDIIALEECDQFEFIYSYLKCYGYEGVFSPKSDTPCVYVANDLKDTKERGDDIKNEIENSDETSDNCTFDTWSMASDGCALFWQTDTFECFDKSKIVSQSKKVLVCDSEPNKYDENSKDSDKRWQPLDHKNTDWNEIIDTIKTQANNKIEGLKVKIDNISNDDDPKKKKKLTKDLSKSEKILKTLDSFDSSKYKDAKYRPILSEESGKVINQAVTFLNVPLQWKRNKSKKFNAFVFHLKSTKSREGEKVRCGQLQALLGCGDIYGQSLLTNDNFDSKLPTLLLCDLNGSNKNTLKNEDLEEKERYEASNIDFKHETYDYIVHDRKKNGLGFESVNVIVQGKEPEYTTWKQRSNGPSKHTIDFIFQRNCDKLWHPIAHLELPNPNPNHDSDSTGAEYERTINQKNIGLLPDWHYPSDHFTLAIRMRFNSK